MDVRKTRMSRFALMLLVGLVCTGFAGGVAFAEREHAITKVRDGLYRVTSGAHISMYWVTDKGIVILDPVSKEDASWLKGELGKRHKQPIRYVVYSHNHYDHVYGGEVFDAPGVVFVSHELARDDLVRSKARTRIPELTFNDELALHLGGQTLRLRYHGPNNGRGSVSILFETQRVLFVVDWIVVGRMPWKDLEGYDIEGMIRSTKEVLALDWDLFVGGHGEVGDRDDVKHYLDYLESLYGSVRDGMLEGKSLETLRSEIRLDRFSDLKNYEAWLPLNIEGVYRILADQSYMLKRPDVNPSPPSP